jgi:hypothetical protein
VAALEGKARPGKVEARHERCGGAKPRVDGIRGRLAVARASAAAEGKGAEPGGGCCAVWTRRRCRCYLCLRGTLDPIRCTLCVKSSLEPGGTQRTKSNLSPERVYR